MTDIAAHVTRPLPCTLCSWEMKSVWAFSAAFKSVESHKAKSCEWPLGILSGPPDIIRGQQPPTKVEDGNRK